MRAFIAVEVPAALRGQLADAIARLQRAAPARAARWVRPESIHLTLKFLGDMPLAQTAAVQALMDAAARASAPFECAASGLGCFPNCRRPRVFWAGVRETAAGEPLLRLHQALEEGAAALGFAPEPPGRGFNPHLTLARAARDAAPADLLRLGEAVQAAAVVELGPLPVAALSLMKSELRAGGSIYTRLHLARLGEPAPGAVLDEAGSAAGQAR